MTDDEKPLGTITFDELPIFTEPGHYGVLAVSGGGKTVLSMEIFDKLESDAIYILYSTKFKHKPTQKIFNKYPKMYAPENIKLFFEMFASIKHGHKKIIIVKDMKKKQFAVVISELLDKIMLAKKQNHIFKKDLYIFMDEVHLYQTEEVEEIATSGRNEDIFGIFMSQRPALINRTIIAEMNKGRFWGLLDDSELTAIRRNYGIRFPQPVIDYIQQEYKFHFVHQRFSGMFNKIERDLN